MLQWEYLIRGRGALILGGGDKCKPHLKLPKPEPEGDKSKQTEVAEP